MRIGVDASCWANGRGYGRFARELLSTMVRVSPDDDFVFFLDPASEAAFDLDAPNVTRIRVAQSVSPTEAASVDGNRSPFDMLRFTRAVAGEKLDVFFSPSVYTYFPLPPGLRAVVAIHDAIVERFPELTLPTRRARWFWAAKVGLAVRQARLVLSVSEFAADDVAKRVGVKRDRIRVAVEAPAEAFRPTDDALQVRRVAEKYGMPGGASWFIYVGGFNPHKNLDDLVAAYAAAIEGRDASTVPYLLLVGSLTSDSFHRNTDEVRALIDQAGLDRVVWPGFVPDEELRFLYAGALAGVLPSACEGFGLPAVEAAACGTPVIATTESPLPQLLAGGGFFVDPGDRGGLSQAMRSMIDDDDRRGAMARVALDRTRALSWESCAADTLAALHEAGTKVRRRDAGHPGT